ncbi:DNA helicase [Bertholletia excelsa]
MFRKYGTSSSSISFNPSTSKYSVNFAGKTIETVVTDKAATADQWVSEIYQIYGRSNSPVVVGLDIEWRPHPISYMSNKTATLQLCIDDKCLIVQLFYVDEVPASLKDFLADQQFIFVGVEVEGDITKLRNEYGLDVGKSADLRELAKARWPGRFRRPGLKDLAADVASLNMAKPKHVSMSNWEARVLNEGQVEYACIDAYASYKIGHKLILEN